MIAQLYQFYKDVVKSFAHNFAKRGHTSIEYCDYLYYLSDNINYWY